MTDNQARALGVAARRWRVVDESGTPVPVEVVERLLWAYCRRSGGGWCVPLVVVETEGPVGREFGVYWFCRK